MPNLIPFIIISSIWVGAFVTATLPSIFIPQTSNFDKILVYGSMPLIFLITFPLLAGCVSLIGQKGIIKGIFPRKPFHPIYLLRRIYGACWTQFFYFKPVYAFALAIPALRNSIFRLFGYRGSSEIVIYPDTWIRDLPLLKIGKGSYISNRATIGTNICLSDGNILVDSVTMDENVLVGHIAVIGPCILGKRVEIGVNATMGIRVKLGENVKIGPRAGIGHGVKIGAGTKIGQQSHIGLRVQIGENINVPAGANIPGGAIIIDQSDMEKYYHSETEKLHIRRDELSELFSNEEIDAS